MRLLAAPSEYPIAKPHNENHGVMMGSWWNSTEMVGTASAVARWGGAVLAIVILALGNRASVLQARDRKAAQSETDLKVSASEAETALAKEQAAKAAAHAEEAKAQASKLALKTEELRRENLELERAFSPRTFEHQETVSQALSKYRGMGAAIQYMPDLECKGVAEQIAVVLKMADWKIFGVGPASYDANFFPGVAVQLQAFRNGTMMGGSWGESGDLLVAELKKTKIEARRIADIAGMPPGVLLILVGNRGNPALAHKITDKLGEPSHQGAMVYDDLFVDAPLRTERDSGK